MGPVTRGDPWISCRGGSRVCSPLGLVHHSFPPIETLEFRIFSLILVSLLRSLENYVIVDSALRLGRFLIVDLIEQGQLVIIGGPMVFQILRSSLMVRVGGVGMAFPSTQFMEYINQA
jgi:hypothetical protein